MVSHQVCYHCYMLSKNLCKLFHNRVRYLFEQCSAHTLEVAYKAAALGCCAPSVLKFRFQLEHSAHSARVEPSKQGVTSLMVSHIAIVHADVTLFLVGHLHHATCMSKCKLIALLLT